MSGTYAALAAMPSHSHPGPRSPSDAFAAAVADSEHPASVLIAEDHEDSLDAMRTLLRALGYLVYEARNGREAVERARDAAPDLVLMDMMMPEMDGFQATRTLRADAGWRQVPIIAVTAMDNSRADVLAAGCTDMVLKPIDVRAFLERLPGWLRNGHAAAS